MLWFSPYIERGRTSTRPAITLWWLVVLCTFFTLWPSVARADTLTAECRVFQRYMIDTSGLPVEFDYQLIAVDAGAPMPSGSDGTSYTWTFRRDDEDIIKIPVDTTAMAEGSAMYTYTMRPVTTRLSEGLYYDRSNDRALEYTLEVYTFDESVFGSPIVQAIVRNPDGTKVADPGWYIYLRASDSDEPEGTTPGEYEPEGTTPGEYEPEGTTPGEDEPVDEKSTTPERTLSDTARTTQRSSTQNGGTGSVGTSNARTTSARDERIARTGDANSFYLMAFVGSMGLVFLAAAHLVARGDRARAKR